MGNVTSKLVQCLFTSVSQLKKQILLARYKRLPEEKQHSILVLGPPKSGKTTIIRRLSTSHEQRTSGQHLSQFKTRILEDLKEVGEAFDTYLDGAIFTSMGDFAHGHQLNRALSGRSLPPGSCGLDLHPLNNLLYCIYNAGYNTSIYKMLQHGEVEKLGLPESAVYFFDNIQRIWDPNYVPTFQDVLHTWTPNVGLGESRITYSQIGHSRAEFWEVELPDADDQASQEFFREVIPQMQPDLIIHCVPFDVLSDKDLMNSLISLWKKTLEYTKANNASAVIVFNKLDVLSRNIAKIYSALKTECDIRKRTDEEAEYLAEQFNIEDREDDAFQFLTANLEKHPDDGLQKVVRKALEKKRSGYL